MSTNNNNNKTHDVNDTGVQTDEKKQHFDDIYICETPVPYKIRILDDLSYVSDDFNREMFDTHIVPVFEKEDKGVTMKVQYVDLCACFGNTTMAALHQMSYNDIRDNWSDETRCQTIDQPRRTFNNDTGVNVTAIDISPQAMAYGKKVGLYDRAIVCDLNQRTSREFRQTKTAMDQADIVISTAALVYLELDTIEILIEAFANGTGSDNGRMLVNFLNPFALEKADATKRILLSKLDFVASRATRHRRMSPLEQENYPGEEWSLLELWVLQKKKK